MVYTVRQQHVVLPPRFRVCRANRCHPVLTSKRTTCPGGGGIRCVAGSDTAVRTRRKEKSTMIARWNKALAAVAACALFAGGSDRLRHGTFADGDAENITLVVWASQEDQANEDSWLLGNGEGIPGGAPRIQHHLEEPGRRLRRRRGRGQAGPDRGGRRLLVRPPTSWAPCWTPGRSARSAIRRWRS